MQRTSDCLDVGNADGPFGLEGDLWPREAGLEHGYMALRQQHDSPVRDVHHPIHPLTLHHACSSSSTMLTGQAVDDEKMA